MIRDWTESRLDLDASILQAMQKLGQCRTGIVLVVDPSDRLIGTVVDGDIRRSVLRGEPLESGVVNAMNPKPIVARIGQPLQTYLDLMVKNVVQQLPLVEDDNRVAGLVLLHELKSVYATPPKAVIMAGGLGTRMRPLTEHLPKPMLPVGERPIMEHIVNQLRESGIREVVVSTHYKGEMIQDHFGDGSSFGLQIQYVNERERYGTIGSLKAMREHLNEPFVVVNGDILTTMDFAAMLTFHHHHRADLTVAVRKYEFKVPYGVMTVDQERVVGLEEKPMVSLFINAGIYLINPDVLDYIPGETPFDATDLISILVANKRRVTAFPVLEYWMDIGQPGDYERANSDVRKASEKASS